MHFSVLGPLRVTGPDGPVALGGPRQRAVLALLLVHADREVATSRLIDGVWAESPPPTAERTLHAYMARLRGLLEPDRAPGTPPLLLTRGEGGYRLRVRPSDVDSLVLESAVTGARLRLGAGDAAGAAVQLQFALATWRGPALCDLLEFPALSAAADRLERLRADAVADLVDAELRLGKHVELVPRLAELVDESPFDERLWCSLALAQYRASRQADALETVRRARHHLVTELGIEPGPALHDLQHAILTNDAALGFHAPSAGAPARPHPGLEGRGDQLHALRKAWSLACSGHGGCVIVSGPEGIGRSRLLRAFAAEVHASAGSVVEWRGADAPTKVDEPADTDPGGAPVLVLADDVETSTPTEWRLLKQWIEATRRRQILVLLAIRDACVTPELGALLARIDPTGERSVRLSPLEPDQIARVAASYVGPAMALEVAMQVAQDSAGIPARVHAEIEARAGSKLRNAVSDSMVAATADWSGARRGEAALVTSLLDLSAVESAANVARALATGAPACPYPGLVPFDASSAGFFVGREELVALGIARLAIAGSLIVVGASGVGKSSLVRAGMIPALLSGAIPGSDQWRIDLVTPTLGGLTATRHPLAADLLVVDQAEELFGLDPSSSDDFVRSLQGARGDGSRVVLVVRSDMYTTVVGDPRLDELGSAPQLLVGSMTDAELARAIQVPLRRAGTDCEPGLVQAIVADVSGELGALPLLSTTMRELWELCPSGLLTLAAYHQLGGIRDAVARLAERAYSGLDDDERSAAREILVRMASPGEGNSVVRGFVQLDSIASAGPTRRALDRLVTDRLVTVDEAHASVAHEALFAQWPRLAAWLAADSEARAMRTRIGQAASTWAEGGHLDADLLRGPRLSAALELVHDGRGWLTAGETAFIDASERADSRVRLDLVEGLRAQRKINRRLRTVATVAAVALLVATSAVGLALHARDAANRTATQSAARGLAAQALTTRRLDVSLLLAAQAAMLDPGVAARSALLAAQAKAPQATRVFTGTGQRLDTVAVGGPGPIVVAIDRTRHADAFSLGTGLTTTMGEGPNGTQAAAFSPDGTVLALGGAGRGDPATGHIEFVNPSTRAASGPAVTTPSPVVALRFAGRAPRLAAVMMSGETEVLDTSTHAVVWSAQGAKTPYATTVDLSQDGHYLTANAPAVLWNVGSRVAKPIVLEGDRSAITPDGSLIAVATGTQIRLVQRAGLTPYRVLGSSAASVESMAFSPDGSALASGSDDGSVVEWDVATGQRRATFAGHDGRVNGVAFSPDGQSLVSAATDGRVVAWDLTDRLGLIGAVGSVRGVTPDVMAGSYVAVTPTAGRMLVGTADGRVLITRFPGGGRLSAYTTAPGGNANDAQVSRDGDIGAVATSNNLVSLWDLRSGRPYSVHPTIHTPVQPSTVAISPDDRTIAWGDVAGGLTAMSLVSGQVLWHRQLGHPVDPPSAGSVMIIAFSPDGSHLAVGVSHIATDLIRADGSGAVRSFHSADDNSLSVVFSPDGGRLATADSDGSARVWTLSTGAGEDLGTPLGAASAAIFGSSFGPTGDTLVTYAADGTVQLWDAATASPVGPRLTGGTTPVMAAGWLDNDTLATFQADGTVRRIAVGSTALQHRACTVAGRTLTRAEWSQYLPDRPYSPACKPS
ncbi:BTAD domain-containing putative transcriptional regulator [Terrabacter sp. Ter38]|uniref:nSTAND1 domain-containing NTPase n=1 Tax=Terrabacter sp. Ter38 TaxID=2926030 RepID=UPI0021195C8A|nr:BTAD domain-containing putative transcriptional regulator [Terrabacter sp. Ter38]